MNDTRMDASFLSQHVQTLDRFERQVIMLRYVEQLTPLEIGLVLHCDAEQIFQTLADVQRSLRRAINDRAEEANGEPICQISPANVLPTHASIAV